MTPARHVLARTEQYLPIKRVPDERGGKDCLILAEPYDPDAVWTRFSLFCDERQVQYRPEYMRRASEHILPILPTGPVTSCRYVWVTQQSEFLQFRCANDPITSELYNDGLAVLYYLNSQNINIAADIVDDSDGYSMIFRTGIESQEVSDSIPAVDEYTTIGGIRYYNRELFYAP